MKIQIIHRACGGTEFLPQPSRLHLGAQNAEGVDRLQFQLPESWADCAIALYLRRSDGTQLAPVPLDGDACVTVDRRLTGCTGGQWMLAAVSGSGYTAYTRPGRYDTYATLPTDGGSEDLPPTLYEQFVARVLESASTAATAAQSASASAERCTSSAAQAQTAARQASTSSTLPDAKTPGPVRIDPQYGVAVREDATLTLVPASAEQLDSMTDGFAPLTPALLPYGVKKALTTASTAAGWTGAEKTAALRTLGADLTAYYTRLEADAKFGTPYSLPPATADQLGGVKVGEALDIAPDGTLSAKTLNDKIAAAVAVKSEPRLVWNTYAKSPERFTTWDVQIPGNVDKICITKGKCSSYGNNTEKSIARGGTTIYDCNYDFTITFQTNGILHVAYSHKTMYPLELWIDGYHYPTLADLLTQVTAVESSVTDLQVALCELYEEKEEN